MDEVLLVAPVLPEKVEAWRRFCQEIRGRRRQAYEQSRRNLGISREMAWLAPTQDGAMAVIAITARNLTETWRELGRSQRAFDRWFRRNILEIHGLDLTQSLAQQTAEVAFQWNCPK